jgi:tRNA(fMet)-specific endonuclease VapC
MILPTYLLDTNILLAWLRGKRLGRYIRVTYQLDRLNPRAKVCIVSHGEIRSLARKNRWGPAKLQDLEVLLAYFDVVDINDLAVIHAYVDLDEVSFRHPGGAINMGKNDLWIAAAAKAQGLTLLTTDKGFDHLHPTHIQRIYIDPASALPPAPGTMP